MNTQYQIYHESVVKLAATLVIKDQATCDIINQRLTQIGYTVDEDRPETWKYYLNLAGRYHPSDKRIYVTSMDTQEEIELTPENMLIHRATWREYQYGSRYYKELRKRYPSPDQDVLINGILNPIDIQTAIAAPDHTILYYDQSLVEARETNLIPKLQDWINGLFVRWANVDYQINNPYFTAAKLAVLFMSLPEQIKTIRMENCKTNKAHSYHIRRYLASFGPIEKHYRNMTDEQRLWFYRNIRWVLRNVGKQSTFDTLVKKLLTDRSLPLAQYLLQQNDSVLPELLDPTIQFERVTVNGIRSSLGDDIINTRKLLELENPLNQGNVNEQPYAEDYIPFEAVRSLSSESQTKVLESNLLDMKEAEPYTLTEVLLNHWIYWADKGIYQTVLVIPLPDGGDGIRLDMKEAYLVFQYLYYRRLGIELPVIPHIMAKRVRRTIIPSFNELRELTSNATPDLFIHEARRDNPDITSYVSVDAFVDVCSAIQDRMMLHRDLYCYRDDLIQYAEVRLLTERFYHDVPVDMDAGQNYAEWLNSRGLSFDKYSTYEMNSIMENIINQATGLDLRVTQTLADIHKSMTDILRMLSSYSLQIIQTINENAVVMFDNQHLRWHDNGTEAGHQQQLPVATTRPLDLSGRGSSQIQINLGEMAVRSIDPETSHDIGIDLGVEMEMSGLNQTILEGWNMTGVVSVLSNPVLDLSTLNAQVITIPSLETRDITELFEGTASNDFAAP